MNFNEKIDYKQSAIDNLVVKCRSIITNYEKLYDEDDNRDKLFMKELVNTIIQVDTLTYVFVRDGEIHPNYCLEKLNIMKGQIDTQIRYWEARAKEINKQ